MKKILLNRAFLLFAILICQLFGCTSLQHNVSPNLQTTVYREGVLKGERVLIPDGVPDEVFYPNIVNSEDINARSIANNLSLDELAEIVEPIVNKYPNLSLIPLESIHLSRILHDFPDFKDEQSVREKSDVVLQYYNGLIKAEVRPIIKQASNSKNGRVAASSPFGYLNSSELAILDNNLVMIGSYRYASNKAIEETIARFGTDQDGLRGNAFQHAVWNCLIAREAMYKAYSKSNAILFTRDITSAHERDDNGNFKYGDLEAMDLHNNLSARSWFGNNTSTSIWPFSINCPSETNIFSAWYHAATNRNFHICTPSTVLTLTYSWEFLYGEDRSDMGDRLYFFMPILPNCQ